MAAQQSSVVLPVRALDGRATSVRLPAASSVRDLKAALRVCFPPAQAAPAFHLFLRGGKLLLDAKLANLSLARGEFVSLVPFTAKPAARAPPTASANPANPRAAAKRSKFSPSSSTWRGEDVYAKIARVPVADPASPSFYCHGVEPLDLARMVEHLRQGLGKHGQIRHVQVIPGREASFSPLPSHLSQPTMAALRSIGVTRLYSHQAQAIAAATSGSGSGKSNKHVVVSTSTSSGKSLCYNVPVLESISRPGAAPCALYIFPTKALAQDQLKTLLGMTKAAAAAGGGIYDGDTPMKDRARIRDGARLLITNPDMLHVSILPCHAQFWRILCNLEHVVIDEAHSYRGAFGCHAALILRRLRGVCADVYGSHPTFISCTATLANPREHVAELAGLEDDDGDELELVQNVLEHSSGGVWRYVGPDKNPARAVSIRAIEHDRFKVVDTQGRRVLEEIEESKAFFQVHDGAVYMHQGVSYLVEKLDLSSRTAYCRAAPDLRYYTRVHDVTEITVLGGDDDGGGGGGGGGETAGDASRATAGGSSECRVTTKWVSFDRIWRSNDELWDTTVLDLPPYSFRTQAAWVRVPEPVRAAVERRGLGFAGGVHAASHALLSVLPLRMMCASSDLGTRCGSGGGDGAAPPPGVLLLYDKHPGGIGLAAQVERLLGGLLAAALQLVSACGCAGAGGCPSCVQSFACGGHNRNLDKQAAAMILRGVFENERCGA